jgi:subtilisin family serine protease
MQEGILMVHRRLGVILVSLVLLLGQAQAALGAAPGAPGVAADPPAGVDKIPDREPTDTADYIVEFTARADVDPARRIDDFTARGAFVVDALQTVAVASQQRAAALARNGGTEVEQFWFRNAMVVRAPSDALVAELRALPGVADVRPEKIYPLVVPVARAEAIRIAAAKPEWGVSRIGADAVWEQGILGSGIVVANVDTGVDYTHPALVNQYRGNLGNGTFSHDYNWWDPTGICGDAPCDNVDHRRDLPRRVAAYR